MKHVVAHGANHLRIAEAESEGAPRVDLDEVALFGDAREARGIVRVAGDGVDRRRGDEEEWRAPMPASLCVECLSELVGPVAGPAADDGQRRGIACGQRLHPALDRCLGRDLVPADAQLPGKPFARNHEFGHGRRLLRKRIRIVD